jgi:hypothetical protein
VPSAKTVQKGKTRKEKAKAKATVEKVQESAMTCVTKARVLETIAVSVTTPSLQAELPGKHHLLKRKLRSPRRRSILLKMRLVQKAKVRIKVRKRGKARARKTAKALMIRKRDFASTSEIRSSDLALLEEVSANTPIRKVRSTIRVNSLANKEEHNKRHSMKKKVGACPKA